VIWLRVLVLLLDVYLLLTLGSWFAYRFLAWRVLRSGRTLQSGAERLEELRAAVQEHLRAWPREPRPGRYATPDRLAYEHLATLRASIAKADRLLPSLSDLPLHGLGAAQILLLGAVGPLRGAIRAWRDARALWALIDRANVALSVLDTQATVVQDIPARTRATLNELRAEVSRLTAVLEAVQEEGLAGLEQHAEDLHRCEERLERALDLLDAAGADATQVYEVDKELQQVAPTLQRLDQVLSDASQARGRVQSLLARVYSGLRLAEERWEGLKSRGATEPLFQELLDNLRAASQELPVIERSASLTAFQDVTAQATSLEHDIQSFMVRLDGLDAAIRESKEALADALREVDEARAACDEFRRVNPSVVPDTANALVQSAAETWGRAQETRAQGTLEGYRRSEVRADEVRALARRAHEELEALPQALEEVQTLFTAVDASEQAALRERLKRVTAALEPYSLHWERHLRAPAARADAALQAAAQEVAQIPEAVRSGRRLLQSEIDGVVARLSAAQEQTRLAEECIEQLESARERIAQQRTRLDEAMDEIAEEKLPALEALQSRMLPELLQRLELLTSSFEDESAAHRRPEAVDYDEALNRWLPAVQQQVDDLLEEHHRSVRHYGRLRREALRRVDHLWTRLERLDPFQLPAPQEDVRQLARDVKEWRAQVDREEDNPAALSELLSRDGESLMRRLERAIAEVEEGRSRLATLSRDYLRLADSVSRLQAALGATQAESAWPAIVWNAADAEEAWKTAQAHEEESRNARTMQQAGDHLQHAVNAARRAEQLYSSIHRYMRTALNRLDDETRAVQRLVDRGRRLEESLRQEGRQRDADEVAALLQTSGRALQTAERATTFEDALRHVRSARTTLDDL